MDTYEKKYNEALERAKQIMDGNDEWRYSDLAEIIPALTYIFPQLRESESEDERIRKALIDALKVSETIGELKFRLPYPTREECIAYLEKQKEPTTEELYAEAGTTEKEYIANTMKMVRAMRERKKEQKPISQEDFDTAKHEALGEQNRDFTIYHPLKNGNGKYECIPYSFYGSLSAFSEDKDLMDFLRTCFYTKEECEEWIKQKEQKPDIALIQRSWYMEGYHDREFDMEPRWIIKTEEGGPKHEKNPRYGQPLTEMQKPAEWSEEDEAVWMDIKSHMIHGSFIPFDKIEWIENRLKSLRPSWKPSEEQMAGLETAISTMRFQLNVGDKRLNSLYEQLKKLM